MPEGQGELAAARRLFERALTIRETALGSEHPDTRQSRKDLALALWFAGDLAAARQLSRAMPSLVEQLLSSRRNLA